MSSEKKIPNKCILLNKESGETSFQSLGRIKKELNTGKVGHTGTLDKFAHGLMIVLSGKLTRLNQVFTAMDKSYRADIRFGEETDTLDPSGRVISNGPIPSIEEITKKLDGFLGPQQQVPPLYSAIHVDGKRAWKRALEGENVEMKARFISIHSLRIIQWEAPVLTLDISCSKGTYIRSLARDLAMACDSRGHLSALCRTTVGPFSLEDLQGDSRRFLDPWELPGWLDHFYRMQVDSSKAEEVGIGRDINLLFSEESFPEKGFYGLFNEKKQLLAVVDTKKEKRSYLFVVPPAMVN